MKPKQAFLMFLVFLTTTLFGQGLSINGQDDKKSNARLTTVAEQSRLMFHNEPIAGLAYYDDLPAAEYAKNVNVFAKIARDKTIAQFDWINTNRVAGKLKLNANGALPLNAAESEALWNAKVKRMKLTDGDGYYTFVSVDNALNGSTNTVIRKFHPDEEFFVLDLRAEGLGLFVLGSALCGNPGEGTDLLLSLDEGLPNAVEKGKGEERAGKKDDPALTKEERELVEKNQDDRNDVTSYHTKEGVTVNVINKPIIIAKSGDSYAKATGGDAKADASNNGGSQPSGSGGKKTYIAEDEGQPISYETYSPNAVRRGGSSSRCLDCGNNGGVVYAPSDGTVGFRNVASGLGDLGRGAGAVMTGIAALQGKFADNDVVVVNGGGGNGGNSGNGGGSGTNTGTGEMGYGIP